MECSLHNEATSQGVDFVVENTLLPDARRLLEQAQGILYGLSMEHPGYGPLNEAIADLQMLVNMGSPSSSDLVSAMGSLTQALAAVM